MTDYSIIAIIYNPNATGNGQRLGQELIDKLKPCLPNQKFELIATKHIAHAEEVAYTLAKKYERPLVISASGDGGYHEVVNGLMRAQTEGANPTAGLLPAGNANDHHRNNQRSSFVADICTNTTRRLDLIKLVATVGGQSYQRYAHSYIGFGANAEVADKISTVKGKTLREVVIGLSVAWRYKPAKLIVAERAEDYYGLIFSNVRTMAKWFRIARSAKNDDGQFELNVFKWHGRLAAMVQPFLWLLFGFRRTQQYKQYKLRTVVSTTVQLDGEVITIDADSDVTVTCERQCWRCII